MTLSPPSSSWSVGSRSPSNLSRPYGSSSTTSTPCARTSSTSRRRPSSGSVTPAGFWKVGIVYRGRRARRRAPAPAHPTSIPSPVSGTPSTVAPNVAQRDQGAVVGRILDQRPTAAAEEELLRKERDALQRAVDQQHAGCIHAVALADPLAQRRIAAGRVRQRPGGVGREGLRRGLAQVVDRQHVGRRDAAGEGDLAHPRQISPTAVRRRPGWRPRWGSNRRGCRAPRAPPSCRRPCRTSRR